MNQAAKIDLADLQDAVDHLLKLLPKMTLQAKVDVAARLRGVAKTAEQIDKTVKDEISTQLKGKDGVVPGEIFKASRMLVPTTRLDQKALEVEQPKIYAKYLKTTDQYRVTFEVR